MRGILREGSDIMTDDVRGNEVVNPPTNDTMTDDGRNLDQEAREADTSDTPLTDNTPSEPTTTVGTGVNVDTSNRPEVRLGQ